MCIAVGNTNISCSNHRMASYYLVQMEDSSACTWMGRAPLYCACGTVGICGGGMGDGTFPDWSRQVTELARGEGLPAHEAGQFSRWPAKEGTHPIPLA